MDVAKPNQIKGRHLYATSIVKSLEWTESGLHQ